MRLKITTGFLLLVLATCFPQQPRPTVDSEQTNAVIHAYFFAYPLVLMEMTRRSMTMDGSANFENHFAHSPFFPDDHFRQVVRPNADTLYSSAWLDLSDGPVLLHVPDTQGRYYVMQFMDAWSETFASIGKRTTGAAEGWFVIVGPDWKGELPSGAHRIDSPTKTVWLLGRTQTNGISDYDRVHAIQAGYQLSLLSRYPKVQPPLTLFDLASLRDRSGMRPPAQVEQMQPLDFFHLFAQLLQKNAPHPADEPMIRQLESLGILKGANSEQKKHTEPADSMATGAVIAGAMLEHMEETIAVTQSGWSQPEKAGHYGTAYKARAFTARYLLGANPPEDAVYLSCRQDGFGKPLHGLKNYVLHFRKDEIPPVHAFWSVSMYDHEGYFVANPIHRFVIGDRDPLKFNPDGSLDLYIQHDSPGADKESNWLPAPEDRFNLALRLYWPDERVLSGRWAPPPVMPAPPASAP